MYTYAGWIRSGWQVAGSPEHMLEYKLFWREANRMPCLCFSGRFILYSRVFLDHYYWVIDGDLGWQK